MDYIKLLFTITLRCLWILLAIINISLIIDYIKWFKENTLTLLIKLTLPFVIIVILCIEVFIYLFIKYEIWKN